MVALIAAPRQYVRPRMFFWTADGGLSRPEATVFPCLGIRGGSFGSQRDVGSVSHEPTRSHILRWFTNAGMSAIGALQPMADDAAYGSSAPLPPFARANRGISGVGRSFRSTIRRCLKDSPRKLGLGGKQSRPYRGQRELWSVMRTFRG